MLKDIKEIKSAPIIKYYINFTCKDDCDSGFRFPATDDGEPDFDKMTLEAKANYESCLLNDNLEGPEFVVDEYTTVSSVIGRCACGREVELDAEFFDIFHCTCGRWYNVFGRELKAKE